MALYSLPSKQHDEEQLDVTVSVLEESKSAVAPSSSKKEGLVLLMLCLFRGPIRVSSYHFCLPEPTRGRKVD